LPGDILVKVDRASMASSLEVRAPLLDHRIVEFAFSKVPNPMRVSATERKILLQRLAAKLLPPEFDAGRKQGFAIPLADWLTLGYRSRWCDRFEAQFKHVFDFSAIRPLLKASYVGGVTRTFGLLFLMHWMETYGVTV
jgi:asparagine synthase (glutamine-hydrolysing)